MKKRETLELNFALGKLKDKGNTKFKYAVIKNIAALKSHVSALEQIDKENKTILTEFEKDRNDLIVKVGKKGEGDKVFIDVNDSEMFNTFNEGLKVLLEKHKESLDKFEAEFALLKQLLEEDVEEEPKFRHVAIEECPEEGITADQLEMLIKYDIVI